MGFLICKNLLSTISFSGAKTDAGPSESIQGHSFTNHFITAVIFVSYIVHNLKIKCQDNLSLEDFLKLENGKISSLD